MLPKSLKKSFNSGVVIPHKIKNCTKCDNDKHCAECNILVIEIKVFEANLSLFKRKPFNQLGFMPPYYQE